MAKVRAWVLRTRKAKTPPGTLNISGYVTIVLGHDREFQEGRRGYDQATFYGPESGLKNPRLDVRHLPM